MNPNEGIAEAGFYVTGHLHGLWAIGVYGTCLLASPKLINQLEVVSVEFLLAEVCDDQKADMKIRTILGRKPKMPVWMLQARRNGWTPPKGWDPDAYEL